MTTDPNPNNGGTLEEASLKVPSKDPKKKKDEKTEEDLVSSKFHFSSL